MNALVAYFSATGTTAKAARMLAKAMGAALYEIKPAVPYTSADLNWMDKRSRSSVEMKDQHSRPALADTQAPVADCDVIFLGFPVWWYVAPGARILDGRLLNGRLSEEELKDWVSGLQL